MRQSLTALAMILVHELAPLYDLPALGALVAQYGLWRGFLDFFIFHFREVRLFFDGFHSRLVGDLYRLTKRENSPHELFVCAVVDVLHLEFIFFRYFVWIGFFKGESVNLCAWHLTKCSVWTM